MAVFWRGWCTEVVRGLYDVNLWKPIRREWDCFSPYISFVVGDGVKVRFQHDLCCDDMPLKAAFLELFTIAYDRDASVVDLMSCGNGTLH